MTETASPAEDRITSRWWIVAAWALAALLLVLQVSRGDGVPIGDSDDAMRWVTANDLLAGQGWQDVTQYRDNTPHGSPMHWSRLIDAPVAALYAGFRMVAPAAADFLTVTTWPLLLLGGLLLLSVALSDRLVGRQGRLAAMVLPLLSMPLIIEFSPGRIDHHNIQILLTGGLLLAVLRSRDSVLAGAIAGLLAATSFAIGLETLPLIVVAIAALALFYVVEPNRGRQPLLAFSAAVGPATALHFVVATAPQHYFDRICDSLSIGIVASALAVSAALVIGSLLASRIGSAWGRLVLLGGLGLGVGAGLVVAFPECVAGPYGRIDQEIARQVFANIHEVMPFLTRLAVNPASAVGIGLVPIVGVIVSGFVVLRSRGETRIDWMVLLGFAVAATAVMFLQVRGARLAALFAIPAGVWLIVAARRAYLERRSALAAIGLVASWLLFAGFVQFQLMNVTSLAARPAIAATPTAGVPDFSIDRSVRRCFDSEAFHALAALPAQRVMAPYQFGARILRSTPHSVVGTSFHRNWQGQRDTMAFYREGEDAARAIAAARGLELVLVCDGVAPAGLTIADDGTPSWPWLRAVSANSGPLRLFAIDLSR